MSFVLATVIGTIGCETSERPSAAPSSQSSHDQKYVLRPLGGDASAVKFIHAREPARDVVVEVKDGWRSISADKWMGSNIAYWAAKDLGAPVENEVRDNADFRFDLRWRVGDLASINMALEQYGVEIVPADQPPPTTRSHE